MAPVSIMVDLTVSDRQGTFFVDFGEPQNAPSGLCVWLCEKWLPVVSCRDWYGDERRDELTAANLLEIVGHIRKGAV